MLQNDDSYYELFLLPNQSGFVCGSIIYPFFGVAHLKNFEGKSIRCYGANQAKLVSSTRIYRFDLCREKIPAKFLKSPLSFSINNLLFQLFGMSVNVLTEGKPVIKKQNQR